MRLRTFLPSTLLAAGLATAFALVPGGNHVARAMEPAAATIPVYSHVIVVMEENHSYNEVIGSSSAPYINSLAAGGALMTNSFAVSHPSEPNYMAIYAGSVFGLSSDNCPVNEGTKANLGSELIAAGKTFKGYSESEPSAGSLTCTSGEYARKHSPWVNFSNTRTAAHNVTFGSFPSSSNYASLPTLSFVIPNLLDDMHDGTVAQGDSWLKSHLSAYATWAKANNSLLIVTWDEDDGTQGNQVATIFYGANVITGKSTQKINHYNVLATLEQMYGLTKLRASATATPITSIFS